MRLLLAPASAEDVRQRARVAERGGGRVRGRGRRRNEGEEGWEMDRERDEEGGGTIGGG